MQKIISSFQTALSEAVRCLVKHHQTHQSVLAASKVALKPDYFQAVLRWAELETGEKVQTLHEMVLWQQRFEAFLLHAVGEAVFRWSFQWNLQNALPTKKERFQETYGALNRMGVELDVDTVRDLADFLVLVAQDKGLNDPKYSAELVEVYQQKWGMHPHTVLYGESPDDL